MPFFIEGCAIVYFGCKLDTLVTDNCANHDRMHSASPHFTDQGVAEIVPAADRIEEAIGIKPTDLDDNNVLRIRRVVSNGRVEELAEGELSLCDFSGSG